MPGGLFPPLDLIVTWTPNYVNPETRGWPVIAGFCILCFFAYVIVGLRLFARLYLVKNPGIDDLLIAINLLPLTGLCVALCLAFAFYGFSRHVWDDTTEMLIGARKMDLVVESLYMVSTTMTKVSILLFYRRLAAGTLSKNFKYAVYASIAFVIAYFITFFTVLLASCRPFNSYWLLADWTWQYENNGKYHCLDEATILIAVSAFSVIQDFLACGMPMVLFWKAQIPRKQKFALGAVFGVGVFVCVAGILRIYYACRVYFTTYDMTWGSYWAWIWLAIEANVAVMCASAPALKVYFKKFFASTGVSKYLFRNQRPLNEVDLPSVSTQSGGAIDKPLSEKEAWLLTSDTEMSSRSFPEREEV